MTQSAWGDEKTSFFFEITPKRVLEAVETLGDQCTGLCFALNSMENRVYEVEVEVEDPVTKLDRLRVIKFYRPGRWSKEQILEEHRFLLELDSNEIPVVAPLVVGGESLFIEKDTGIYFAIFPKVGGRSPEELLDEELQRVGRLLARIHNTGAVRPAPSRVVIGPQTYALGALDYLLRNRVVPLELESEYERVVREIVDKCAPLFSGLKTQRIHGDCHFGNLLWNERGPFFLDFDDMVMGPCIQDLWLIVPGRDVHAKKQFEILLTAYEEMSEFDRGTLLLIEPLRALRMIHFSGWIGKRWEDPAFPRAFPQFSEMRYWENQLKDLRDQSALIQGGG